jgi:Late embryogenesis abundant protein
MINARCTANTQAARRWLHNGSIAALLVTLAVLSQGCAGLRPGYETPTVTINSFRTLPSEGVLPTFEIGLHVINPNSEALKLRGVSYTISLEGHDIIKGVGNDLPTIDAYGEGQFKLTAAANLFAGIQLINELMSGANDNLKYEFAAKLDIGLLRPALRVSDTGRIDLRGGSGN